MVTLPEILTICVGNSLNTSVFTILGAWDAEPWWLICSYLLWKKEFTFDHHERRASLNRWYHVNCISQANTSNNHARSRTIPYPRYIDIKTAVSPVEILSLAQSHRVDNTKVKQDYVLCVYFGPWPIIIPHWSRKVTRHRLLTNLLYSSKALVPSHIARMDKWSCH